MWSPRVAAGWSPYSNGYWSWTPYGWTWIPNEPWGWAPFHYGRWGFSAGFGWYWAPGRTWGPGWVSWGVGNGYVGWCPLGSATGPSTPGAGWHARLSPSARGGTAAGTWSAKATSGTATSRSGACRSTGIDPRALRVADSPNLRPTRDGRALRRGEPRRRGRSAGGPTPGDFVRELAVDNKTTIPAPWLRRGRAGAEDGRVRESQDQASAARPRREVQSTPARRRGRAPGPRARASRRAALPAARARRRPCPGTRRAVRARRRAHRKLASLGSGKPPAPSRARAWIVVRDRKATGARVSAGSPATALPRRGRTTAARTGHGRSSGRRRGGTTAAPTGRRRNARTGRRETTRSEPRAQPRRESSWGSSGATRAHARAVGGGGGGGGGGGVASARRRGLRGTGTDGVFLRPNSPRGELGCGHETTQPAHRCATAR